MSSISEVMGNTAAAYHATYAVKFHQVEHFDKGVCHGMCLRWIKSRTKLGFFTHREKGIAHDAGVRLRNQISQIQSNLKQYKGETVPTKSDGGFGSLEAVRINQLAIDAPGWHTIEAGAKAMTYRDLLEAAARFSRGRGITSGEAYPKIAGGACSVIGLEDGGTGHAVATARWKGRFFFMDPNGGVLIFPRGRDFEQWFTNELPNATDNNYDKLHWITVENYQVGASA